MVWPTLGSTTAKEQNNVFNCGLTGSGYVKNMLAVKKHLITDGIQGLSSSTYINVTRKHHTLENTLRVVCYSNHNSRIRRTITFRPTQIFHSCLTTCRPIPTPQILPNLCLIHIANAMKLSSFVVSAMRIKHQGPFTLRADTRMSVV